jgi:3-oxoadipate enol-lactonase
MIETRRIPLPDTEIAVRLCGQGPLCLLAHGYPLDGSMWLDLLQSGMADDFTLCAVDLRGHGASPASTTVPHSMEQFAADLALVARTLSDEPVDAVGLSMGGYAMLAFAEHHPDLLRSLTLVDTRAGEDAPEGKQARRNAMRAVVENGRRWLAAQMLPKLVAATAHDEVRGRLQTMIEGTPVETIVKDLQGMLDRPDRHDVLRDLQVPVLVVVGELDELTPVAMAEQMVEAAGDARLAKIAGAGHMAPMEAPDEFARVLRTFLEDVRGGS